MKIDFKIYFIIFDNYLFSINAIIALFNFANNMNEFISGFSLPLIFLYNYISHNNLPTDWKVFNDEVLL